MVDLCCGEPFKALREGCSVCINSFDFLNDENIKKFRYGILEDQNIIHQAISGFGLEYLYLILPKMSSQLILEMLNEGDFYGNTPLHYLNSFYTQDKIDILIKYAKTPLNFNVRNKRGETPLLQAMKKNSSKDSILVLIKNGADVNIPDLELSTPLHQAALNYPRNILSSIIDLNAKSKANNKGEDVLSIASKRPHNGGTVIFIIQNFEKLGIDQVNTLYKGGNTILHLATKYQRKEILELLSKENINKQNDKGRTPLHSLTRFVSKRSLKRSLIKEYLDRVKYLLQVGADPSIKDKSGLLAIEYLPKYGTYRDVVGSVRKFLEEWQDLPPF